ncbi:hypothetical protein [Mycolicibacterium vaccae]|uniref:hypothetical protein n=1 Tax=Mycolicibacterium vaccae TaxID=1810 RepID=UPI003CFF4EAB
MSSREFLELVEGLSSDSWFKQALNADLRRVKTDQRRAELRASTEDFEARLRGEYRDPFDRSVDLVDKHTLTL